MKRREYIDPDHNVMMEYYDTLESNLSNSKLLSKMNSFIKQDPYFFDPYLVVYNKYKKDGKELKALNLLDKGYQLALEIILDKKGNFPDVLEWNWMENRHIIRIILNKGLLLWKQNNFTESTEIFRKLLNSNLYDNVGARYYLLAVLEEMSYKKYVALFESEGYISNEVDSWFDKDKKKYVEEFSAFSQFEKEM